MRMRQTLEGSFSAVSKPNFASKYSLESSRRDLHNALESNPPMKRNGRKEENGKTGRKGRLTMAEKNNGDNNIIEALLATQVRGDRGEGGAPHLAARVGGGNGEGHPGGVRAGA